MEMLAHATGIATLVTVLGIAGCIAADHTQRRIFEWIGKPAASLAFVALGFHTAAGHPGPTTTAFLTALVLSLIGDMFLMMKTERMFLAGLGAFLLGHLGFVVAFLSRGVSLAFVAGSLPLLAGVGFIVGRWLLAHVPGPMKVPVLAYMSVISAMVACAVGTYGHAPAPMLLVAALSFFASDLAVARQQFVNKSITNRYWGLPLYFGAQLVFAANLLE